MDVDMQQISNALAPVVLLSLTALLMSNVGKRDADLALRIRCFTEELRAGVSPRRRASIRAQLPSFRLRLRLAQRAHLLFYCAELVFTLMLILLSLGKSHGSLEAWLLMLGLTLLMLALALEVIGLSLAGRTISEELTAIDLEPETRQWAAGPRSTGST
ncbi:MAG TPA: DUF2721 domain-containing protein [Kofleriaceae bacterium]|nr:DUF2721 domain-containing protein [Kofleriaceae bacterium]